MKSFKKIVTHDGVFHADEVTACAFLRHFGEIVRTRDPEIVNDPDNLVLDVGGIHDPENNRFDHHQKGGAGARPDGVPYSSVGALLASKPHREFILRHHNISAGDMDEAYELLEKELIRGIDAVDNGYRPAGLAKHPCPSMTVSRVVSTMNPGWYEPKSQSINRFYEAVLLMGSVIQNLLGEISARKYVREAFEENPHATKVKFLSRYLPWQTVAVREYPELLYVVFPSASAQGRWMVQAVPKEVGKYDLRKPFPEAWWAKKPEELTQMTGIEGLTFVHANGFIASAKTFAVAMKVAALAV